jgi:hypothetical protein
VNLRFTNDWTGAAFFRALCLATNETVTELLTDKTTARKLEVESATLGGVNRTNWPAGGGTSGAEATNIVGDVNSTGTVYNASNLGGVAAASYVTGGVFSVGTAVSNVQGTLYIPTNTFGGGGGGTDGAAVTNIAKDVAFGVRPTFTLTSAATVTIPRLTGTNHFILTCTNSTVTLGVATGSWALADFHFYTLSVNRGTNTLAFDTASITNSTVLDVSASTDKTLLFLKPYNSYQHRVRE